uniref:Uncharacterized protein n=1 Tax=Heterorhabditis bacteriophora TaxID=37862 RepID=A0A1I7WHK4_HETBA
MLIILMEPIFANKFEAKTKILKY